jgi:hypothetical protein
MADKTNEEETKSGKILRLAKSTLQTFSAHGIPKMMSHEIGIVKAMWLIFFLASAGTCAWFIQMTISNYLSYPVTTNTDIVYQKNMIFPIISICDLNLFSTDSMSRNVSIATSINSNLKYSNSTVLEYSSYLDKSFRSRIFANEYRKKVSSNTFGIRNLSEIMYSCSFSGSPCNLSQDFESYYDINYGNCFRFNSGKTSPLKSVNYPGLISAFNIEMFIGMTGENRDYFSFTNGFNIFINNETLDSTSREGVSISPGTFTKIIVDKYSIIKQPKPYSSCTSDLNSIDSYKSPVYKRLMSYSDRKYHFTDCNFMCFQKYLGDKCQCQNSYFNFVFYPNLSLCSRFEDLICWNNYNYLYFSTNVLESCDCPLECEYSGYTFTNSWSEYPTLNFYEQSLINSSLIRSKFGNQTEMNYENVRKSVAKVSIFYNDLRETVITESVKISVADLVSSIGGTLGLFIGMSLLTLIEVLEIFVQSLVVILKDFQTLKQNRQTYP